jgi:hypothetical protein
MVLVGIIALLLGARLAYFRFLEREQLRYLLNYYADQEQLQRDFSNRLRVAIADLRNLQADGQPVNEATDYLFELLQTSRIAKNSREVDAWRNVAHSTERTDVALKWGLAAADEAAYQAAIYHLGVIDLERGRLPHYVTDDEVPPYKMPDDWTAQDRKHAQ